jgi:hypothetical protein
MTNTKPITNSVVAEIIQVNEVIHYLLVKIGPR